MPTKNPRSQKLTREQQRAHQVLTQRQLRIEHGTSNVTRCRLVKDRSRLWKAGVRDLVMARCCALQHFQVRLTPWQPMVASGSTQLFLSSRSLEHGQGEAERSALAWSAGHRDLPAV